MVETKKVRDMNPEELKAYRHALYAANPAKARARTERWKASHPEAAHRAERIANKNYTASGGAKRACKRWRRSHLKQVHDYNVKHGKLWREANPEAYRQWYLNNIDASLEKAARYRARKVGASGEFTEEQFRELGDTCLRCQRKDVPMTADHVLPLSKGGSNDISNIQPLCGPCNSGKKDRHVDYRDWYYGA